MFVLTIFPFLPLSSPEMTNNRPFSFSSILDVSLSKVFYFFIFSFLLFIYFYFFEGRATGENNRERRNPK